MRRSRFAVAAWAPPLGLDALGGFDAVPEVAAEARESAARESAARDGSRQRGSRGVVGRCAQRSDAAATAATRAGRQLARCQGGGVGAVL